MDAHKQVHTEFSKSTHEWVRLDELAVHPKVQRQFRPTHGKEIRDGFDPDKFGELVVVQEKSGQYFVLDGQHRCWAAKELFAGDQQVPCQVYRGLSLKQSAELYLGRNTVKQQRALDKFKVAALAGHGAQVEIIQAIDELGLTYGDARQRNMVQAVTTLENIYHKHGAEILRRTLKIARDTWGGDATSFDRHILAGIAFLLRSVGDKISDREFAQKVGRDIGPGRLLGMTRDISKTLGIRPQQACAEKLLAIYNHRRREQVELTVVPMIPKNRIEAP